MTKVFKRIANKRDGIGLYILTARQNYKPIVKYLNDIGINTKNKNVLPKSRLLNVTKFK